MGAAPSVHIARLFLIRDNRVGVQGVAGVPGVRRAQCICHLEKDIFLSREQFEMIEREMINILLLYFFFDTRFVVVKKLFVV